MTDNGEENMITRKRIIPFVVLCALSWTVSSCLEDINLDTGERILNVYCILNQGPEQELELSYITPTGGISKPAIQDATITLFDGGTPVGQFVRSSEEKWSLDFSPQSGHTYRLEVNVPGEDVLTAETKFPAPGTLRIVSVQEVEKIKDLEIMAGGPYTTGYGFELDSPDDQFLWCFFEPSETPSVSTLPAYVDYIATDHPGADGRGETIFPFDSESPIIQEYFDGGRLFYQSGSVLSEDFLGGPVFLHENLLHIVHPADFSRPVGDGKLNVFQLDKDLPFGIKPEVGTSRMFGISGVSKAPLEAACLVICCVSPEYDAYLADYYYGLQDSDDFSVLVYKRNHYSNVRNGVGIFGAFCELRVGNFNFGSYSFPYVL